MSRFTLNRSSLLLHLKLLAAAGISIAVLHSLTSYYLQSGSLKGPASRRRRLKSKLEMQQDEALAALSVKGQTEHGAPVTWTLRAQELIVQQQQDSVHIRLYNVLDVTLQDRKLEVAYVDIDSLGHGRRPVKIERRILQLGSDDDDDDGDDKASGFRDEALRRAYRGAVPRRRALVLINPNAGNGRAAQAWEQQVKPIFSAAGMAIAEQPTTERNGARRTVQAWDLGSTDCIVVCSGDGLIHEVFNGLAFHSTGNALAKVAVAHVPCGSGNALARNLYGSPSTPDHAALAIVKGIDSRMDLMEITQKNTDGTVERSFSFLSQAVGMLAECDLDTEWMRKIAPKARFDLGFLSRAIQCKKYRFDVAFKTEMIGRDALVAHAERHRGSEQAWETRAVALGQQPREDEAEDASGQVPLPRSRYGSVLDPLADDWQAHRFDDLATLWCGNMPYMSSTDHIFTTACMSDGTMDLIYARTMNPLLAIDCMGKVAGGKADLDSSSIPYQKISGLRVTPLDKNGSLSIDGERFPWRPFQAEIHRGLGRVISSSGVYLAEGPSKEQRR